ncbi:DNA-processing protein DprA [Belnapia arida]|nr:DNA-processing protein DprA [Belnapia arida]
MTADTLDRLRLARTEGLGPQIFQRLLARFGTARVALEALPDFSKGKLVPPAAGLVEREMATVARMGGRFFFLGLPGYPPLLETLYDPPPALALLGDPAALAPRAVAIVGARSASTAGRRVADALAADLARAGLVIVSGMARGIDAAAHLGAMREGRTVAVVATGLDRPYPAEHAALQARIAAEGGAVLAEAPLGTAPLAQHFPRRNRIVAALAMGVVVVEAAQRSGSLITARLGLELGRELFAVPGNPLDLRCRGSNDLIRQGAHLTESAEDVLPNLPEAPHAEPLFTPRPEPAAPPAQALPPSEAGQVFELLGAAPIAVDEVVRRCHLSPSAVQTILLEFELAGRVEMLPGNRVALTGQA